MRRFEIGFGGAILLLKSVRQLDFHFVSSIFICLRLVLRQKVLFSSFGRILLAAMSSFSVGTFIIVLPQDPFVSFRYIQREFIEDDAGI